MKNKILLLLSAVLIFASCEDFLTETPKHQWDTNSAVSTYENATAAITGIYGRIMKNDAFGLDFSGRLCAKLALGYASSFQYDYYASYKQSNSPTLVWNTAYSGINAANFAIEQISKLSDDIFPTSTAKNELLGEARFLRGYLHSLVMLTYCHWWTDDDTSPYGVIYRTVTADASNTEVPRSTVGESWRQIFEDIEFGVQNMSKTFATPRKVSQIFAKGWYAKLLMVRGDFEKAQTLVEEALAALPAAGIAMQADMAAHFDQAWDSKENIFVRYLEDDGNRTSYAGNLALGAMYFGVSATWYASINGYWPYKENAACGITNSEALVWMRSDPRWDVVVSVSRHPYASYTTNMWTFTKVFRKGQYAGQYGSPKDEKYAIYFMRVPELYIMKAECLAHNGASYADAIAPINEMRAQRTNPVLPQIATPATQQEVWDIIFQEYCKELILENGCEFFAAARIPYNGTTSYLEAYRAAKGQPVDFNLMQWPIPQAEMINNLAMKGMQNPGQE